jgi:protein-disulfide isomerase
MRRLLPALLICATIFACVPRLAAAQGFTVTQRAEIIAIIRDAMKQDPSILRDAILALQADDEARSKAGSRATLADLHDQLVTASDPVAGNPGGDVTVVEFFDTRCPYCRQMEPVMTQLLAQDPNLRLVYKDLPILGPPSVLGSRALLASRKQGGYEKLREAVMKMPPDTTKAMIEAAAEKIGLDWRRLSHDMDDPTVDQQIQANLKLAHALSIEGTPALVIGGEIIPGAVTISELTKAVSNARHAAD